MWVANVMKERGRPDWFQHTGLFVSALLHQVVEVPFCAAACMCAPGRCVPPAAPCTPQVMSFWQSSAWRRPLRPAVRVGVRSPRSPLSAADTLLGNKLKSEGRCGAWLEADDGTNGSHVVCLAVCRSEWQVHGCIGAWKGVMQRLQQTNTQYWVGGRGLYRLSMAGCPVVMVTGTFECLVWFASIVGLTVPVHSGDCVGVAAGEGRWNGFTQVLL